MTRVSKFLVCGRRTVTLNLYPLHHQLHRLLRSSHRAYHSGIKTIDLPEPQPNYERLCDPSLTGYFAKNIQNRKGVGNIQRVIELNEEFKRKNSELVRRELLAEALLIPNETHPEPSLYGDDPKVIKMIGSLPEFTFKPLEFDDLMEKQGLYRMQDLARLAGHRAYYFVGELAELEHALIRFTLKRLVQRGFSLLSVPDILHHQIIESCGMNTNAVYHLDPDKHLASAVDGDLCLSGTAEMALGGFLMNRTFAEKDLPRRLVAVSRCYRVERTGSAVESGLFRVHQFTKVEMFSSTVESQSDEVLEQFRSFQEESFGALGLHLQVLDMPSHDLGAPAFRKYDLEAWMPGRKMFGEVSSCSNCTDYQSRRLNIQYSHGSGQKSFVHTVNGTACAIPRLIMAICETHQQEDGTVRIPKVLQPYMKNKETITQQHLFTRSGKKATRQFRRWNNVDSKAIANQG